VKVCIYGAGAIGGYFGTQLAASGCEVSAVARGATLAALREYGWRLQLNNELLTAPVHATADPQTLGAQELVIIAVKAPALESAAADIGALIGPNTLVLSAMNGVPWWFFDHFGGAYQGTRLTSIDPHRSIAAAIPTANVIGCVTHVSCSVSAPGLVQHHGGQRLIVGEQQGVISERIDHLATVLSRASLAVEISTCIQADIWYKLWGNMTMNPVSAFTGATTAQMLDDPLVSHFCLAVMREAAAIGAKLGCPIVQSGEDRNAMTRQLSAFKTSMLQDVEARKPVEIDALVAVVREIGGKVDEPTPNIDTLLGLARLHARVQGLYPA
jgi:2-dehydropantoate 2-reductase